MISEDTLLRGSWYALEQAGRLLRSAVTLFDGADASTALVLAMFGREELGRSRILRDLAGKVRAGEKLTAKQISKSCEDHIAKQEAAALSTALRVDPNTQLSAAVQTRVRAGEKRRLTMCQNEPLPNPRIHAGVGQDIDQHAVMLPDRIILIL